MNDEDLRHLPLFERKSRLRGMMPRVVSRTLDMDHIATRGRNFFVERRESNCA